MKTEDSSTWPETAGRNWKQRAIRRAESKQRIQKPSPEDSTRWVQSKMGEEISFKEQVFAVRREFFRFAPHSKSWTKHRLC